MRGRTLLSALAVLAVVVGAGALLLAATGATVERGSLSICPEGSTDERLEVDGRHACTFSNLNGTEVTFGAAVRNDSRLPLTLSDVPMEALDTVGFTPTSRAMATEGDDRVLTEFEPVRLSPGEERLVQVDGELPACEERTDGGATTFTALPVEVRVLGIPRSASVELDPAVRLVSEPC